MLNRFTRENFHSICDQLAARDADLQSVIQVHGYPPFWNRTNSFESLVHIILEQQVSLASAKSALNKLKEKIGDITPQRVLLLSDEELKACYFSRQKTVYTRSLANAICNGHLNLEEMISWPDQKIREVLLKLKGIGNWTVDIYLIFCLQHSDVFPSGDLAAVNALRKLKKMDKGLSRELLLKHTEPWRPNRTIATMILWHYYLSTRAKKP